MRKYFRWFCRVIRPFRAAILAMMACHVLLAFCSVGFVYSCKKLVDVAVAAFEGYDVGDQLYWWGLSLIIVVLSRLLLNSVRSYLQTKTEINIKNRLRYILFDIMLHLKSDGGRRHHSGDLLNRMLEDVRVVATSFSSSLPNVIGTMLQFIVAFAFLIILDVRLALIVVVLVPAGVFVGRFITRRMRDLTHNIRNSDSQVQSHLQESIQHLTLLQTLEYADSSSSELETLQNSLYEKELKRTRFSVVSRIFVSLAFSAGHTVTFLYGVFGISEGTISYGMMTAFLQLVGQIQRPLVELSTQIPSLIHATASIDRLIELEELPREDFSGSRLLPGTAGISIKDVDFAYPDSDHDVLNSFSYDFAPGSRTAIVGPTGVGKSTLIKLMLSLLKPRKGSIELYVSDGNRLPASADTRCNMVYVPQGNSLFSGSIRENLLMGNPDATEHEMLEALKIAAADFVGDLPSGLDTQCFEAGAGLSEGQAQRIAIARALLRPGSVLLLDEFSSALDAATESALMERLTAGLPDHTMIFITHREKIIDYCDSVLRLESRQ
ncbi:MAG: ABC transporter ATP-binding protein [Bacteroidales bacterium]|nr:ABC transporter ATP-binding protein [Bacteroidales bacterium]